MAFFEILILDDIRSAKQNFIQFNQENLGFLESLAQLLYVEQDIEVYDVLIQLVCDENFQLYCK